MIVAPRAVTQDGQVRQKQFAQRPVHHLLKARPVPACDLAHYEAEVSKLAGSALAIASASALGIEEFGELLEDGRAD